MKIVKPSWKMSAMTEGEPAKLMKHLEAMGRICYQSEDAITDDSYKQFLRTIIERGHEAVLEHATVTAIIICGRGISHELVRHRIASYCQESTRYCNYNKGKFGSEITVVEPTFINETDGVRRIWKRACEAAEFAYFDLIAEGATPATGSRCASYELEDTDCSHYEHSGVASLLQTSLLACCAS